MSQSTSFPFLSSSIPAHKDSKPSRFDAVVDWLELEIRTLRPRVAHRIYVHSSGALSYVTGLDPDTGLDIKIGNRQGKNTPTTRFAIRIQAPERFAAIADVLAKIDDLDPNATVLVRGIEVSFDDYGADEATDDDLAHCAATMLHQINRPTGTNDAPRVYDRTGAEVRYGKQSLKAALLAGKTAMYGNESDDYVVRGYVKDYDTRKGENGKNHRIDLPRHEHRARIEVRLQGEQCPIRTLNDLKDFKFKALARYFKFREPADDAPSVEKLLADRHGSIGSLIDATGHVIDAHAKKGRSRKTKRGTQASPLNEIARDQLRNLTDRWPRASGRSRRRHDGNSGAKNLQAQPTNGTAANIPEPAKTLDAYWANAAPEQCGNAHQASAAAEAVLTTSLRDHHALVSSVVKAVRGITSTDIQALVDDLNEATYPPSLPDLTAETAPLPDTESPPAVVTGKANDM